MNGWDRRWLREWLWCWRAVLCYLQLLVTGYFCFEAARAGDQIHRDVFAMIAATFFIRPLWYFGLPPLLILGGFLLWRFKKKEPEYPCPVCGYDIRMTPHRCPECGTKLRWGQLP